MNVVFEEGSEKYLLDVFDLKIDSDDYVVYGGGERVTDVNGVGVKREEVGQIIHLDESDLQMDNGVIVDSGGKRVTHGTSLKEPIVPVDEETAVVRSDIGSIIDLVETEK